MVAGGLFLKITMAKKLSVIDYAKSIGKSKMTVYRWIKQKQLPEGVKARMCCGLMIIVISDGH